MEKNENTRIVKIGIMSTLLNKHPHLRQRVEALLGVVESTSGDCTKADDAEQYVIDGLRKMIPLEKCRRN